MNSGNCITVFVGDVGEYLADIAKQQTQDAKLINSSNYKKLAPGTYYTSIGDLKNLNQFECILLQAQEIVYAPPAGLWSDLTGMMQTWTEHYLRMACTYHQKKIVGFDIPVTDLIEECGHTVQQRVVDSQQIWIAGCSISHGVGVDPRQRYGNIISEYFNLPVTFLTHSGSSINWAADQILRSDIRTGDIVFWGITGISRLSSWNHITRSVQHCTLSSYLENKKNFLSNLIRVNYFGSEHLKWQSILAVKQVNNFCHKIKAKLIMATLIAGMENYLVDLDNFLPLSRSDDISSNNRCFDLGTDNLHPGPESHKFYADRLIQKYKELYGFKN